MKLLNKATAKTMIRLTNTEHEARKLLSQLDTLDVRLHRASGAVSIDLGALHLDMERKRMLDEEKRAKTSRSVSRFPALAIGALTSRFCGQRPDWDTLVPATFREESFGDIRITIREDNIKLVNLSKMARKWDMPIMDVVAYLKQKGNEILNWQEFEARVKNMRRGVLSGEMVLGEGQHHGGLVTMKTIATELTIPQGKGDAAYGPWQAWDSL